MTEQRSKTVEGDASPDFLRMKEDGAKEPRSGAKEDGLCMGWPTKTLAPTTLQDEQGRVARVRAPVMDLEGLITPTELFYVVQHFDVPEPVRTEDWTLTIDGEVKHPMTINYDDLRRFPGRTVRTVMECSGSDMDFFEYFKGERARPSRTKERMILSAGEFTGTPLAAILNEAGLTDKSQYIRIEGWDEGVPATADEGTDPFFYDKGLPVQKALDPDTIVAWAQNGQLLEHLHGAPARLIVPGWSGNWSVKWIRRLEVLDHMPDCWYHYSFYYFGDSPDDPNKELITTIGVRSIITHPNDDDDVTLPQGTHAVRGYAWSGAAAITQVEVSVDGGETWNAARIEEPRERWMWLRWSYLWDAKKSGKFSIMSRATDAAGRVEPKEPRYNNMRKNFSAVVANEVTIL